MSNHPDTPAAPLAKTRPIGRKKVEARRELVVEQAAALFEQEGYQNTSVADIAQAASIGKATLYHYFASKEEILYWIHEEFIDILIERHERRLATAMPPAQLVLEVMGDILELMDTHRGHVRVFFEHHTEVSADRQDAIKEKRRRYATMLEDVLRQGVDEGAFRPLDVTLGALAIFGMCNWTYQWYRKGGRLRSREIAYAFWDFAMRGLAAPEETAAGPARPARARRSGTGRTSR